MKTLLLLALVWNGLEVWDKRVVPLPDGSERVEMSVYNRGDDTSGRDRRDARNPVARDEPRHRRRGEILAALAPADAESELRGLSHRTEFADIVGEFRLTSELRI